MKSRLSTSVAVVAVLMFTVAGVNPASAQAAPIAPDAPFDAPAYDPTIPAPGPNDITWSELEVLEQEEITGFAPDNIPKDWSHIDGTIVRSAGGYWCDLVTGPVYKRASGNKYIYGTVGMKPITTCNTRMNWIRHETTAYKYVWFGLQHIRTFPNTGYGASSYTQTTVEVICADLRSTKFHIATRVWGNFPSGMTGGGQGAFNVGTQPCGTR